MTGLSPHAGPGWAPGSAPHVDPDVIAAEVAEVPADGTAACAAYLRGWRRPVLALWPSDTLRRQWVLEHIDEALRLLEGTA